MSPALFWPFTCDDTTRIASRRRHSSTSLLAYGAARFGGDDTGLGYVVALGWSKLAASLAASAGWGAVFGVLTFIALFTSLLWHLFFDAAHELMCEEESEGTNFQELGSTEEEGVSCLRKE